MKKRKTPRIGVPPAGFIRVVMDYPEDAEFPIVLDWDRGKGFRIGVEGNKALAPWGDLIRYIRRTDGV